MMGLAATGAGSREGTRMGLWGAAQAIAFGLGGVAATLSVDLARAFAATPLVAYASVFALESALFIAAAILASQVGGARVQGSELRRPRRAPLPSDREEGRPMIDHRGDFRFRRCRRRSCWRDCGRRSREPGPQGCASRPERTHQALRRRDPAAADPRFRDSESPFEGAGAACDR